MKKPSVITLILFGLCAVLWSARCVADVICGEFRDPDVLFPMNVFCAAAWIAAFVLQLIRYRSHREE